MSSHKNVPSRSMRNLLLMSGIVGLGLDHGLVLGLCLGLGFSVLGLGLAVKFCGLGFGLGLVILVLFSSVECV